MRTARHVLRELLVELSAQLGRVCGHGHRLGREDPVDGQPPARWVSGEAIDGLPDYRGDRQSALLGHARDLAIALVVEQDLKTVGRHAYTVTR